MPFRAAARYDPAVAAAGRRLRWREMGDRGSRGRGDRRGMDPAENSDEYGFVIEPLPPEPMPWIRLPPTWRQRTFVWLAWFGFFALVGYFAPQRRGTVPAWFPVVCLVLVAAGIAALLPQGPIDSWRQWRLETARRSAPEEPWLWDHEWDSSGVSVSPFRRFLGPRSRLGRIVFCAVLLAASPSAATQTAWMVFGGVASTWLAWRAWRVHGVGTAHVTFAKFPFHPGERVTLHFGMSEGGARFERAAFCLRHVEEAPAHPFERRGEDIRYFGISEHRPPGELPGGGHHVVLEFDVPEGAGDTRLSESPRVYWALDVLANTSAGPYVESFLIPIYERPAAAVAA